MSQYNPYANGGQPMQQPQYPDQQYPNYAQPQYYNAQSSKWNAMAIAGFVCSFFFSLIGLILSIIGYTQTKKSGERGGDFALAGIIISAVSIALTILVCILVFVLFGSVMTALLRM
ncbi:DUF4190 domain-containing protein [Bifidobacterium criceti]|uniref:Peptidylprolyl isomerase n=1 Tax=Bifidobacterium criceti TaxID=1960969 RepID=A0A2A2EG70_9BIFI|nr:DUF4190 domain-containing protein [Bifidobacterium criceti]PAU68053.1 peptidylprolyl isomerase [Bifidobacterium criceti]